MINKFNIQHLYLPYYLATISLYRGHRGSMLGCLWLIIKPAIQIAIYTIIFPLITRFEQPNYAYYLISGILPWTFISSSLIESCYSLINRSEALKRCLLPKNIFPISDIIKHLILMAISFLVMIAINIVFSTKLNLLILLLPVVLLPIILFTFSCGIALSFITPYVRDMNDIVNIGFSTLFFFTPILYPMDNLPIKAQYWLSLNPIYWLIRPIQEIIYYERLPSLNICIISSLIALLAMIVSLLICKKLNKNVIFYL